MPRSSSLRLGWWRKSSKSYPDASMYFKAGLLSALGEAKSPADSKAFAFLSGELLNNSMKKVLMTSAASAITSINRSPGATIFKERIPEGYRPSIAQNDAGVIGVSVCAALTNESSL